MGDSSAVIHSVGFGTWKIPKDQTADVVHMALASGVRHLDCASDYGNEVEVGQGIRRAIDEGIITRDEIWVTSKLWNTYHEFDKVEAAARKSLADLALDYFDLYMIHFPISTKFVPFETRYPPEWIYDPTAANPRMELSPVPISETWKGMEDLVGKSLSKRIGVCNFTVQSLMDLLSYCTIRPYALQVELHPYLTQQRLVDYCIREGISVVAFSPLGSPSYISLNMDNGLKQGVLEDETVVQIARRLSKTPAQVVLRWNIQRGVSSVIPKSSSRGRIVENSSILDFELTQDDMSLISGLNRNLRFNDPGVFCLGMGAYLPIYD